MYKICMNLKLIIFSNKNFLIKSISEFKEKVQMKNVYQIQIKNVSYKHVKLQKVQKRICF